MSHSSYRLIDHTTILICLTTRHKLVHTKDRLCNKTQTVNDKLEMSRDLNEGTKFSKKVMSNRFCNKITYASASNIPQWA